MPNQGRDGGLRVSWELIYPRLSGDCRNRKELGEGVCLNSRILGHEFSTRLELSDSKSAVELESRA